MTPSRRDPRIAAVENLSGSRSETMQPNPQFSETRAPNPQAEDAQAEGDNLLNMAIPAAGSPEHAEYVQRLLERIQVLERQGSTVEVGGLPRTLGLRVAPKGGVSVYGLNANFPVTLYPEQWNRLFEQQEKIKEFIESNKDVLEFKDEDEQTRAGKERRRRDAGIIPRQPLRNVPRAA